MIKYLHGTLVQLVQHLKGRRFELYLFFNDGIASV